MQNAAKYNGYNKNEYNKTVLLWHLLQALFISFYLLIIIMFARFLGRKSDNKAPAMTKEDERAQYLVETAGKLLGDIERAEKK